MNSTYRILLAGVVLILLGACSSDPSASQKKADEAYNATIHARPGDTYVIGADKRGPFKLTLLNEGAGDVVVTCDHADYESPVTLGPRGTTSRFIGAHGSATVTLAPGQEAASVAITILSKHGRAVPVDFMPGPDAFELMTEAKAN